ncbi:hypothetical protein E1H12_03470 [Geitlerinema sp. P-1104]|uniref:hypothetical protein n=1 Tax=Geitlerinema sp. P-1104 TaxID=2546230 RepID=UPI00147745D9|nr:hypothetical protein [Geitlerinema sp. P-1104]NMG57608.1 hypothetical protein [Geitlerinema sp. P-1104]
MSTQRCLVPPVADLFFQAWCAGTLGPDDRSQVRDVLLTDSISEEDRLAIDRLIHCVRRGWLVMDPCSRA